MANAVYEIEVPNGGRVQFDTWQRAVEWLNAEYKFWEWLDKIRKPALGIDQGHVQRSWHQLLDAARRTAATMAAGENNPGLKDQFTQHLQNYVRLGVPSMTPLAKFIEKERQERGDVIAANIYCASRGLQIHNAEALDQQYGAQVEIGRTLYALFELGITDRFPKASRASLEKVATDFGEQLKVFTAGAQQAEKKLLDTDNKIAAARKAEEDRVIEAYNKTALEQTTRVDQAIDGLLAVEERFRKQMKTEAAVQYWETKAGGHETRAKIYGTVLAVYALATTVLLFCLFKGVYAEASKVALAATNEKSAASALLVLSAGAAVITTVLLWAGRFFQRMFLSERHMGIDARLRATLALTYTAMSDREQVTESDRAIVPPALFRPGSDGIVQEDNSVDGLLAMFAKYLEKGK